jgi:hypothetical protein
MLRFYSEEVSPPHKVQPGGPPLLGYPRLLIQYILNYSPCLEVVSTHNLRTGRAVVTRDPLNMVQLNLYSQLIYRVLK